MKMNMDFRPKNANKS